MDGEGLSKGDDKKMRGSTGISHPREYWEYRENGRLKKKVVAT